MSNDNSDNRRRIADILAGANVDLSSLQGLVSNGAINSRTVTNQASSSAISDLLSALSRGNQVSASAQAPAAASSNQTSANHIMSTLLGLSQASASAPPISGDTLAPLLGDDASNNAPRAQPPQLDLQRLLQPSHREVTSSDSSIGAVHGAGNDILSFLRSHALSVPTPAPAYASATISVDAVLALLNAGIEREQMIDLLQQAQHVSLPPRPAAPPPRLGLEDLIRQLANGNASSTTNNACNSITGSNHPLLQQILSSLPPPELATILAGPVQGNNNTAQQVPARVASSPQQVTATNSTLAAVGITQGNTNTDPPVAAVASAPKSAPAATAASAASTKTSKSAKRNDRKATGKRKDPPSLAPPLPKAPKGMSGHKPETLYTAGDEERLSPFHVLARKHMEFFEAGPDDSTTNARGRNRPIILGQVGIRCKHCSCIAPRLRERGAMYYPFKLELLYQACQTLALVHLSEHCKHIPKELKLKFMKLKEEKTTALVGKKYWADGARHYGIYETEEGMRFRPPAKGEQDYTTQNGSVSKKKRTEE